MLKSIFQVANDCGLGLDWGSIYDWTCHGDCPAPLTIGGYLRWRQVDLDAWLAGGCKLGPELDIDDCAEIAKVLLRELKQTEGERNESRTHERKRQKGGVAQGQRGDS
jgi:predicted DNA-binding transcriptional regulator AlpA